MLVVYARACATPISGFIGHSYLSSWYGLPLEDMANSIFLTGGFPRSKGGGREEGTEGWREEEECDSHRIERQTRSQTHRSWLRQAVIRVLLEARQRHVVLTSPGHRAALIHEHSCTAAHGLTAMSARDGGWLLSSLQKPSATGPHHPSS